jgi:hypothetical protein
MGSIRPRSRSLSTILWKPKDLNISVIRHPISCFLTPLYSSSNLQQKSLRWRCRGSPLKHGNSRSKAGGVKFLTFFNFDDEYLGNYYRYRLGYHCWDIGNHVCSFEKWHCLWPWCHISRSNDARTLLICDFLDGMMNSMSISQFDSSLNPECGDLVIEILFESIRPRSRSLSAIM